MSPTWQSEEPPVISRPEGLGWARIVLRGLPILLVLALGLGLKLLLRLVEAPLFRRSRPVTPWITVWVCRIVLRLMGLRVYVEGTPDRSAGLLVANHVSWSDIFVLNAVRPLYFVAKSEVAGWPGIGWLARATGTVFILRDRTKARAQADLLRDRLGAGHRLMIFPEGTSSDGHRVLRFRSSMFAALDSLGPGQTVQAISVIYQAPDRAQPRFYGWWGDMDLGPHLLQVLAERRQGFVTVRHHPALPVAQHADRKALARAAEDAVRAGMSG